VGGGERGIWRGDGYGSGIRIHGIGRGRTSGPGRGQDDGEKAAQVAELDRATREECESREAEWMVGVGRNSGGYGSDKLQRVVQAH
jgi:hypothetical protein